MKLISSFRDYYDSVSHQYLDKEIIYLREQREILCDSKKASTFPYVGKFGPHYKVINKEGSEVSVSMDIIGFCGALYPAVTFSTDMFSKTLFNIDELRQFAIARGLNISEGRKYRFSWRLYRDPSFFYDYEDFFKSREYFENLLPKFHELNTPCFLYEAVQNRDTKLLVNPKLKDYNFSSMKDPYSAHQEIYTFISGYLNQPVNNMIQISDEDKIHKHGFDRWSFRQKGPKK